MQTGPQQPSAWLKAAWASDDDLISPKLPPTFDHTAHWYRYYAGYADAFVADVVGRLPEATDTILDPWNGAGTTTSVASAHGINARGFDVNPAAAVISKARILRADVAPSLMPITRELLSAIEPAEKLADDDLLLNWMTPRAAQSVRRLAATVNRGLVENDDASDTARLASEMSSVAALLYLALFRVVRGALSPFAGTNPTWLKRQAAEADKVDLDLRTLRPALLRAMQELTATVKGNGRKTGYGRIDVEVADSAQLPLEDDSMEAVITSPPYCTRIDYAMATLPELATLGMSARAFRQLRDRMIGTPTRDGTFARSDRRWGDTATGFLSQVADHASHASSGYYLSFFSQYFAGMWGSLAEIGRVVGPDRPIVLVVQDSYYKEVHADIPAVMGEMADSLGWNALGRLDFEVKSKANINAATRKYRSAAPATEAVMVFSG
jgi:DNA modification methylase